MELNPKTLIIDSSKLKDYLDCPRYFFYRHVCGWVMEGTGQDLVFGTAWHAAMEILYRNGFNQLKWAFAEFLDHYREHYADITDDIYVPKNPSNAAEALELYIEQYANDHKRFEVLHTEVSGAVPMGFGMALHFRMDTILRDRETGHIRSLEHKTTKRGGRTWADQFALSPQVGTYNHVLYSMYPEAEVDGVYINGAIFHKKETLFERIPCRMPYKHMQVWYLNTIRWMDRLHADLERIQTAEASAPVLDAFLLNPQSCTKYFGCAYHDFCTSWTNPLQRLDEVPLGFESSFWDPTEQSSKEVINSEIL